MRPRYALAAFARLHRQSSTSLFCRHIIQNALRPSTTEAAICDPNNASHALNPDLPPAKRGCRRTSKDAELAEPTAATSSIESDVTEPPKKRRGRPPKAQLIDLTTPTSEDTEPSQPSPSKQKRTRKAKPVILADTIAPGSSHHSDLASYLAHADRAGLDPTSNTYVGTHYEYTVAAALSRLSFTLTRVGRASDLGIDLLGEWALPNLPRPLRVLVQCKTEKPRPNMVRELEGAVVGAPVKYRAQGTVAILATGGEATKGVRDAVTRSMMPMAFLNITTEGLIRQFIWNQAAVAIGLDGVGVTLRYSPHKEHEVALTWNGHPWPSS